MKREMDIIQQIYAGGGELRLDSGKVLFRGIPDELLEEARARKTEIMLKLKSSDKSFDQMKRAVQDLTERLNEDYVPGSLARLQERNPELWADLHRLEGEMNHCMLRVLRGELDAGGFYRALQDWEGLMRRVSVFEGKA